MSKVWRFDSTLYVQGGTTYSVVDSKYGILLCKTDGGAITIILPPLRNSKMWGQDDSWILIHDVGNNAATNNITVIAGAGDTINQSPTFTISANGASILLIPTQLFTWSVIGGGGGGGGTPCELVQVTVAQLRALVAVSGLNICWTYEITDSQGDLFTGNWLLNRLRLVANSSNTFSEISQGEYFYPEYQLMNAPHADMPSPMIANQWLPQSARSGLGLAAVNIGDVFIYLGIRFRNLTGVNTDTRPSDDAVNWIQLEPSVDNGYALRWNQVVYDLDTDLVIWRRESFTSSQLDYPNVPCNNTIVFDSFASIFLGVNSINFFQWGINNGCYCAGILSNINNAVVCGDIMVHWGSRAIFGAESSAAVAYSGKVSGGSSFLPSGLVSARNTDVMEDSILTLEGNYNLINVLDEVGVMFSGSTVLDSDITATAATEGENASAVLCSFTRCIMTLGRCNISASIMRGVVFSFSNNGQQTTVLANFSQCDWQGENIVIDITQELSHVAMVGSIIESDVSLSKQSTGIDGRIEAIGATIMSNNTIEIIKTATLNYARIGKFQRPLRFADNVDFEGCMIEGERSVTEWIIGGTQFSGNPANLSVNRFKSVFQLSIDLTVADWDAATQYTFCEMVRTIDDSYWICINPLGSFNNVPPNATYWHKIYDLATGVLSVPYQLTYKGIWFIRGRGAGFTPIAQIVCSAFQVYTEYTIFVVGTSPITLIQNSNLYPLTNLMLCSNADLELSNKGSDFGDNITIFAPVPNDNIVKEKGRNLYVPAIP